MRALTAGHANLWHHFGQRIRVRNPSEWVAKGRTAVIALRNVGRNDSLLFSEARFLSMSNVGHTVLPTIADE